MQQNNPAPRRDRDPLREPVTPLQIVYAIVGACGAAAVIIISQLPDVGPQGAHRIERVVTGIFFGLVAIAVSANLLFRGNGFWFRPFRAKQVTVPPTDAQLWRGRIGTVVVNITVAAWTGGTGWLVYTLFHGDVLLGTLGTVTWGALTFAVGDLTKRWYPTRSLLPYGIATICVASAMLQIVPLILR